MDNNGVINGNNNNSNESSVAIASMVLGILGIITCWVPILGIVLAIIALVLSVKGLNNSKDTNKGRGFSIAGLSCGAVGIMLGVIYMFVWIITAIVLKTTYDVYDDVKKSNKYNYNNNTYVNRRYDIEDDYDQLTKDVDDVMKDIVNM